MIIRNDFNPAECDYIKTNSPITNADRIRSMTDEEMADHLYRWDNSPLHASRERWLEWLREEVTE